MHRDEAGTAGGPSRFFSPAAKPNPARLLSLDAFRGLVIAGMIWVNYIAGMPGIPFWLEHAGPRADGITLPDTVFPAFLFIVGVAIPLSLHRSIGRADLKLAGRIAWRAAGLMLAGVVLANAYRYDDNAAILPRAWYFLLFYVATILVWRQSATRWTLYAGAALMAFLLVSFRGKANAEFDSVYLQHTWWGILGMIGWSYLVCSAIFLVVRGDRAALMAALGGLLALYLGGEAGALDWLPAGLRGFVNVPQLIGSTAANVMAGAVVGTLFVPGADASPRTRIRFMAWFALFLFACGLLLRPYHGINKIGATASFTLVCAALALAAFLLCYVVADVLGIRHWTALVLPAGANAVFAYIAPDLWEQLATVLHLPRFWWPFWETGGAAGLLNAAVMTAIMLGVTALVTRAGLQLKF